MKRLNLELYAVLLVLIALFSACSGRAENSGASSAAAPAQQANSNASPQPPIAQSAAPAPSPNPKPPTVLIPPPAPVAKSAPAGDAGAAKAANASGAANTRAPKLVAPDKKIDFGKQPQDKSLVRAIVIKNGGRADLNIESVAPS